MSRLWALLFLLPVVAGCAAEAAGDRLRQLGVHSEGQVLLVKKADFPGGDVRSGRPSTPGSAAVRDAVVADDGVDAFVRAHGIPDAIAIGPYGLSIQLAYVSDGTLYVLEHSAAESVAPRALFESQVTGQRPLTESELDYIDPDRRVVKEADALRMLIDGYGRLQSVGRTVVLAQPSTPGVPTGENYGMLLLKPSPAAARLFGGEVDAPERIVAWVNPAGPLGGTLQVGDRVTAVNGTPINVLEASGGVQSGGTKTLTVQRAGASLQVDAVAEQWPRRVALLLLPESAPNAFAVDGGIGVTIGLIELLPNDDALAFVIGHELAHITEGHVERRVTPGSVLKGLLTLGVFIPADIVLPGTGQMLGSAVQGVQNRFNRDQERVADRLGVRTAAAAGYDPQAALTFMEVMETKAPVNSMAQFLDIHPPYPERKEILRAEIAAVQR